MHHLSNIDYIANNGNSFFHKINPIIKILAVFFILISLILSKNVYFLLIINLYILSIILLSKIQLKEVFILSIYSLIFSSFFSIINFKLSFMIKIFFILKSFTIALLLIFLITTTSYMKIFSILSYLLPNIIVDVLIITYRSFFMLLDKIENLLRVMILRGGYKSFNIIKNLKNLSGILGVFIIHSIDYSERLYQVFLLRGYNGKIPIFYEKQKINYKDISFLLISIIILGVKFIWNL